MKVKIAKDIFNIDIMVDYCKNIILVPNPEF